MIGDPTASVTGESDREPTRAERVRTLRIQIRFLSIQEETANFEDREAIRRKRRELEAELAELAGDGDRGP